MRFGRAFRDVRDRSEGYGVGEVSLLELAAGVVGIDGECLYRVGGHLIHGVDHDGLHYGAQSACSELELDSLVDDEVEGVVGKLEFHAVELEEPCILTRDCVLRLGEDAAQGVAVERIEARQYGEAADDFGNKTERLEVLRLHVAHQVFALVLLLRGVVAVAYDAVVEARGYLAFV